MDNPNINFVCNQGYAQAVRHVHFHLVPAPIFGTSIPNIPATVSFTPAAQEPEPDLTTVSNPTKPAPPTNEAICRMERGNREELDDNDAPGIAERIRSRLGIRSVL